MLNLCTKPPSNQKWAKLLLYLEGVGVPGGLLGAKWWGGPTCDESEDRQRASRTLSAAYTEFHVLLCVNTPATLVPGVYLYGEMGDDRPNPSFGYPWADLAARIKVDPNYVFWPLMSYTIDST